MKKLISLVLCILMLSTLIVGCKKNEEEDLSDGTYTEDTGDLYDENGYLKDSIPDDIDYGGAKVSIMGWDNVDAKHDFSLDLTDGNTVTRATYERNKTVEQRIGVELAFDLKYKCSGADAVRYQYVSDVERIMDSGTTYDLIACYSQVAANFATDGRLLDLMQYKDDILEFDKPWWSSKMVESSTINDKLYFASGAISTTDTRQTFILSVNLEMVDSLGLDDPRQLVKDNAWTLEKFYEMCTDVYVDTDTTNTPGKDSTDIFGYSSIDNVMGDGFFTGAGLKYLSTDNTGKLIIAPEFKGEKTYNLSETLMGKFKSDNNYFYYFGEDGKTKNIPILTEGRALFMSTMFGLIVDNKNKIDYNYGYLPYPKYNSDQTEYYSNSGFPFSMWCMTNMCIGDMGERAAYVMEALASGGYRTVQPEVYEQIQYEGNTDATNLEMFEIILAAKTYDMGRIFHNQFKWENAPVALFRMRLYKYDTSDWYSVLSGSESIINDVLKDTNEDFGY